MEENKSGLSSDQTEFLAIREGLSKIRQEIGKTIVGQDRLIELILVALIAEGHVLLEGNPGVAKTLTAKLLAKCISSSFQRIQFTPDLMPSDVLGTSVFNFKNSEFEFKQGPIFANLILIDEINRAPAKTQAALFEVMEEKQVTIDGHTYNLPPPFMILATQNPIEMEGTYRLPEAQMDRFFFKIQVDYPNLDEEILILNQHHRVKDLTDLALTDPVLSEKTILDYQKLMQKVTVEEKILRYIAEIVQKTRSYHDIFIGASPRASISLLKGTKALAIMRGRDFVIPEDVVELAIPVLEHRISILPEREMEGEKPATIIRSLLKSIEVPR